MLTAVLVIAILVFLIVIHELGHFFAAKIFKVKVTEFGVGYPPRALRFGKWGDTEYTLNWIPFGGFVRLFGEEGDKEHGRGSFMDSPRWKQAVILVAGVAMNAIAGWALFTGAYAVGILHPVDSYTPGARLIVTDVVPGSPADVAGLKIGDDVIGLSDQRGERVDKPTPESVMAFVSERAGEELTLEYAQQGATSSAIIRPAHAVVPGEAGRPAVGVGLALVTTEAVPLTEAAIEGYYQTKGIFLLSWQGLGQIVHGVFSSEPALQNVTGPVGLVSYVSEAAHSGFGYLLSLAAFISVNLAVINLIPIPALDGGRLVIVLVEMVMRRSAPKLLVQFLNTVGLALIIMLMVAVTYQDIARLLA